MIVDVRKTGRAVDASVINETTLFTNLLAGTLNIPQPEVPPQGRVQDGWAS